WQWLDAAVGFARAASVVPAGWSIAVLKKSGKILEHRRDQRLLARILTLRRLGKKAEYIICLRRLRPIGCRRGEEMGFQLVSAFAKRLFVGPNLGEKAPGF